MRADTARYWAVHFEGGDDSSMLCAKGSIRRHVMTKAKRCRAETALKHHLMRVQRLKANAKI